MSILIAVFFCRLVIHEAILEEDVPYTLIGYKLVSGELHDSCLWLTVHTDCKTVGFFLLKFTEEDASRQRRGLSRTSRTHPTLSPETFYTKTARVYDGPTQKIRTV